MRAILQKDMSKFSHCCSLASSPGHTTYDDNSKGTVVQLSTAATDFYLLHSLQTVSGPTQPRVLALYRGFTLTTDCHLCSSGVRRDALPSPLCCKIFSLCVRNNIVTVVLYSPHTHRWTPCVYIYTAQPSVRHSDRVMEHITDVTAVLRNKALGFNQGCD